MNAITSNAACTTENRGNPQRCGTTVDEARPSPIQRIEALLDEVLEHMTLLENAIEGRFDNDLDRSAFIRPIGGVCECVSMAVGALKELQPTSPAGAAFEDALADERRATAPERLTDEVLCRAINSLANALELLESYHYAVRGVAHAIADGNTDWMAVVKAIDPLGDEVFSTVASVHKKLDALWSERYVARKDVA